MSYNGWTNYETWAAKLWIDNEYGLYLAVKDICLSEKEPYEVETQIRALIEEGVPDLPASLYSDLLNAAMGEINWTELAAHCAEEWAEVEA